MCVWGEGEGGEVREEGGGVGVEGEGGRTFTVSYRTLELNPIQPIVPPEGHWK